MASSYRQLKVWQDSFALAKNIYVLCSKLPSSEKYGLASQIQRSAVSIPSNIAEGQQRNGPNEFRQFIGIARGSAAELSTQLMLVQEVYNINTEDLINDTESIQKMLYSLQNKL